MDYRSDDGISRRERAVFAANRKNIVADTHRLWLPHNKGYQSSASSGQGEGSTYLETISRECNKRAESKTEVRDIRHIRQVEKRSRFRLDGKGELRRRNVCQFGWCSQRIRSGANGRSIREYGIRSEEQRRYIESDRDSLRLAHNTTYRQKARRQFREDEIRHHNTLRLRRQIRCL